MSGGDPDRTLAERLPAAPDPDLLLEAFTGWASDIGLTLYPAQEEALLAILGGSHVIVDTPTGSGKSLVAIAAHFAALARGERSYYSAPLKALVSEKFFALVDEFGSQNVGLITGDSAVNPGAPIICCTAEILAGVALRGGPDADVGVAIMDEFHFYADPQRGWAWQVPLLELPRTQFVLMSATLGDTSFFARDLTRRTGRPVELVQSLSRPVPLNYSYSVTELGALLTELAETGRTPVYVVHFSQGEATERAQALVSTFSVPREQRDRIAAEIGDFRFGAGFGQTLSRLIRHGIGVHHAGMLPKYRRLVERLTQAGLLTVVCGTDTLGVGINVPIRTVVFTSLVKFDGERMRHLSAREFHQIAGRAGRAGFDTMGDVVVQAPEHVIENAAALAKAGDDERKRRKIVRKKARPGAVNWTDKTFERLRDSPPEPLTSQFQVNHQMVLWVLARPGDPVAAMAKLVLDNHDPATDWNPHVRRAIAIYRSLKSAGIVEHLAQPDAQGRRVRLLADIPDDFALNQPLSPFALAALELLDPQAPSYALDLVSVIEATLDNPRQVLSAQEFRAKGELVERLKAEGYDYDERMALLDEVTFPQPLAEELEAALAIYRQSHPWVDDYELSPKSVVRDMIERAMTFREFVSMYKLARSEGIVLRYLTDAYRALRQTIPADYRNEEFDDIVAWLGETVRAVDSSLLDEWERLQGAVDAAPLGTEEEPRPRPGVSGNPRAFRVMIRNAMFRRVELAARDDVDGLEALDPQVSLAGRSAGGDGWDEALEEYYAEYDHLGADQQARSPELFELRQGSLAWMARQVIADPDGNHDWAMDARIDLVASDEQGEPALSVLAFGPITGPLESPDADPE